MNAEQSKRCCVCIQETSKIIEIVLFTLNRSTTHDREMFVIANMRWRANNHNHNLVHRVYRLNLTMREGKKIQKYKQQQQITLESHPYADSANLTKHFEEVNTHRP